MRSAGVLCGTLASHVTRGEHPNNLSGVNLKLSTWRFKQGDAAKPRRLINIYTGTPDCCRQTLITQTNHMSYNYNNTNWETPCFDVSP